MVVVSRACPIGPKGSSSSCTPCQRLSPALYDKRRLQRACRLSQLAYLPSHTVLYERGALGDLPTLSDLPQHYDGASQQITRRSNLQAYSWRFEDEGQLWIGFNGTMDLAMLLEHIKCKRTALLLPNHPELRDIQAHAGFVDHFAWLQHELERDILRTLASRKAIRELVFVGHSSGSCAAQVAALYFGSLLSPVRPDVRVSHIGFGAPRLGGGRDLAHAFRTCVSEHTLVVNHDDVIPSLPPPAWGFGETSPYQLWLYDGGAYRKTTSCNYAESLQPQDDTEHLKLPGWKALKPVRDHSLTEYMNALNACLEDDVTLIDAGDDDSDDPYQHL